MNLKEQFVEIISFRLEKSKHSSDTVAACYDCEKVAEDFTCKFGEFMINYEHGSTTTDGVKKWRYRGGGVYSKCSTIEELLTKFKEETNK